MKTAFKPEQHGFAFVNSWKFKPAERTEMRQTLVNSSDEAGSSLAGNVGGLFGNMIAPQLARWVDAATPDVYGLCGGMAFATADYFYAGKPLPRRRDYNDIPDSDSPTDKPLRDYLWRRQMESLGPNAPVLLSWMAMLHLPLPFAGPGYLLKRTREEFANLKTHLDINHPRPICLIGSSKSPFNNHQVLAIGYDDPGDGTATLYLYDMNAPGHEQIIKLDFRGAELQAEESAPSPERGALRGFFLEHYSPAPPPDLPPQPGVAPSTGVRLDADNADSLRKPTTKR